MATLPDDEEKLRIVLDVFKAEGSRPGEGIPVHKFLGVAMREGLQTSDIQHGIATGHARGLFEEGPKNFVLLTDAGFAAV